jgi:hypothetical protein
VTIPFIPRRSESPAEFHLGSTSFGRADGDFEATLIVTPGGEPRVRLTQLAWGAGVGWYAQRTLELGVEEAHQIAALLNRAPHGTAPGADDASTPGDLSAPERSPIDLAEARVRRTASRTGTAPSPTRRARRGPTPTVSHGLAELANEGSANG